MWWSSLKQHFRTNPVTRLVWGIEPASVRHRFRAGFQVLLPTLGYIVCLGLEAQLYRKSAGSLRRYYLMAPPDDWGAVYIYLNRELDVRWTCVVIVLILVTLTLSPRRLGDLGRNWPQVRMAGITPTQLLIGTASPSVFGIWLVAALQIGLTVALALVRFSVGAARLLSFDDAVIVLAVLFALLGGTWLNVSLLAHHTARARITYLGCFLLCSPILPHWVASAVSYMGLYRSDVVMSFLTMKWNLHNILIIAEILSWPLRGAWLVWFWRRSIDRLELVS